MQLHRNAPIPSLDSAPLTILVVDDEEANRRLLEKALGRQGHRILLAESGEQALERYIEEHPDLVLMDVMLPGWDGFETTRRIRAADAGTGRWVPLIFLSAMGATHSMIEGLGSGGDDYLAKPVNIGLLDAKIAAMRRIAMLQRELNSNVVSLRIYFDENEERQRAAAVLFERLMRHDKLPRDGRIRLEVRATDGFSGDLAGAARSGDGRDYLMLADAAGHGLTAAINVIPVVDVFHALAERGYSLPRIAATISARLRQLLPSNHFVAIALACADPSHGEIEVLNAGMPPILLLPNSPDGELQRFPSTAMPLGADDLTERDFSVSVARANAGAQLFAYSDGLPEARIGTDTYFSRPRLERILREVRPEDRFDAVFRELEDFLGTEHAHDDISLAQLTMTEAIRDDPDLGSADAQTDTTYDDTVDGRELLALNLGPAAVRNADLVPQLTNLVAATGLLPASSLTNFDMLLRELVNNAIDHGLLCLPAREAFNPDDYRSRRQAGLEAMTHGELGIRLANAQWHDGAPCWKLTVTDTGSGFAPPLEWPPQSGLARVAATALALRIGPTGNRIELWLR